MKLIVEISTEELRGSKERAEKCSARRLPLVEWMAKDLANDIAARHARSQKAQWAITEMLRGVILAQLTAGGE
jgi:hypothetical protein